MKLLALSDPLMAFCRAIENFQHNTNKLALRETDIKFARQFIAILGSNPDAREKNAKALAQAIDADQSDYQDIGFDKGSNRFVINDDFKLGFGYRPIDQTLATVLKGIDNLICFYSKVCEDAYQENQTDLSHGMSLDNLLKGKTTNLAKAKLAFTAVDFAAALVKHSKSIPGKHRVLAKLAETYYRYFDQGVNNENEKTAIVALGEKLHDLINSSGKSSVSSHQTPEPFAKAFSKTNFLRKIAYSRPKAEELGRLEKYLQAYEELNDNEAAQLKTQWQRIKAELMEENLPLSAGAALAAVCDDGHAQKLDFTTLLPRQIEQIEEASKYVPPYIFMIAEAKFNPSNDFNLTSLKEIYKAPAEGTESPEGYITRSNRLASTK